jgi:hypothetical protein
MKRLGKMRLLYISRGEDNETKKEKGERKFYLVQRLILVLQSRLSGLIHQSKRWEALCIMGFNAPFVVFDPLLAKDSSHRGIKTVINH